MKESEYICATNRVKVSAALRILRSVLPGDEYGISDIELGEIVSRLVQAEDKLFHSYQFTAE